MIDNLLHVAYLGLFKTCWFPKPSLDYTYIHTPRHTMDLSIISYAEYRDGSHCGYCDSDDGSCIYGFLAKQLPVKTYGALMDKGFRRSGSFLYKCDMRNSCCPQYTIRLDVNKFKPTKEQKKSVKKMNKFLDVDVATDGSEFDLEAQLAAAEKSKRFTTKLLPSVITDEKFQLYKKYQVQVHKDDPEDVSMEGFHNFLCMNPFNLPARDSIEPELLKREGGHIHQAYYLDGTMICLAVLDVIPNLCVSSVYLIRDPEYTHLDLGKYSSMKEIMLARELGLGHYYLGFYIHDCPKMNYKGAYSPSELLDPTSTSTPVWYPLDEFKKAFEESKYPNKYATILDAETPKVKGESTPYLDLEVPGVLSYDQVIKQYPELMDFLIFLPPDDDDLQGHSEYRPIYLGQIAKRNKPIVNMIVELAATISPELCKDFAILAGG